MQFYQCAIRNSRILAPRFIRFFVRPLYWNGCSGIERLLKDYPAANPKLGEGNSSAASAKPPGLVEGSRTGTSSPHETGRGSDGGGDEVKPGESAAARLRAGSSVRSSSRELHKTATSRKSTMAANGAGADPNVAGRNAAEKDCGEKEEKGECGIRATVLGERKTIVTLVNDRATVSPLRSCSEQTDAGQQDASEAKPVQENGGIRKPATDETNDPRVPFSMSYVWLTIEGGIQKLLFASTMGLTAVALSALLWVVSTPWIAWRLLRWAYPAVSDACIG